MIYGIMFENNKFQNIIWYCNVGNNISGQLPITFFSYRNILHCTRNKLNLMSIKIKCIGTLNFIHHISQILCCTVFAHCLHFILALRFAWKLAPSPLVAVRLISLCLVSETISSNISPSPRTSLWILTTFLTRNQIWLAKIIKVC